MFAWLERYQALIVGVLALIVIAGLVVREVDSSSPEPLVFRDDSGLPPGSPIHVHVAGAVVAPGVYQLRAGDRVVDAVAIAGGPVDSADLDKLNMARRLRDEEQILVPGRPSTRPLLLEPGAKIDVNTADERQLGLLPGIGDTYARRIVDSRKVDGPFKSVQELVDRRVLPRATLDTIRDFITVGTR
jgi:competence protein ComEA